MDEYGAGHVVYRRNSEHASPPEVRILCPFCTEVRPSHAALERHQELAHPTAPPPRRSLREPIRDAADAFRG
jgi:hypothetical protein